MKKVIIITQRLLQAYFSSYKQINFTSIDVHATTNFSVTRTIQFSFLQGIFNRILALAKFQDFFEIVFLDFATTSLVATKES